MNDLFKAAFDYLARREHSRYELGKKLKSKASDTEIQDLLDTLSEQGLLSDARFTESYIRTRAQAGIGPIRIAHELAQRGVNADLVTEFLNEDDPQWWRLLQRVWQKKYHNNAAKLDQNEKARRVRFLVQRGFSHAMIINLLNLNVFPQDKTSETAIE